MMIGGKYFYLYFMEMTPDDQIAMSGEKLTSDCGCGAEECFGPEPVPWLSWKHCIRLYEFRYGVIPLKNQAAVAQERIVIRVRYEHALCLLGRKQGPIVHSMTLLPQETIRIYEYDRYKQSTSVTNRFSVRTSFYTFTQRVQDAYSSTKVGSGASVSTSSSVGAEGGGGINLGIFSIGGGASTSSSTSTSAHFNVSQVSENFSHVAQTSSQAVESERSVVVSTHEENESFHSLARTLVNKNECRAVTYYIRRMFEVYELSTRVVGVEVLINDQWIELGSLPDALQKYVKDFLAKTTIGASHNPKTEIYLPSDGLLFEAEQAHCCSCDCERESMMQAELAKAQVEVELMRLEAMRRKKLLDSGEFGPFEPAPPTPVPASP